MKKREFVWAGLLLIFAALSLVIFNVWDATRAGRSAEQDLKKMQGMQVVDGNQEGGNQQEELYEKYPELTMPTVDVEGKTYIGTLRIPALNLELPILETLNPNLLQIAPCRYEGSIYMGDMIIAGHNYYRHFGKLAELGIGDEVLFQDVNQHEFSYQITEFESIPGNQVELMESGKWDLTLFTCDYSGRNRITVRCQKQ